MADYAEKSIESRIIVHKLAVHILLVIVIIGIVCLPVIMQMLNDALPGWISRDENYYYYYEKGHYYSGCSVEIGNNGYRFDKEGHCYRNEWYEDAMGRKYFYGEDGAMLRDQWLGGYYFFEDGKMAKNQYADRIWIGYDGQWGGNRRDEAYWRVDGNWRIEDGKCIFVPESGKEQLIDLKDVRSICLRGWGVGAAEDPPLQSIASYEEALKRGFNFLLCDLQFTADDVPVCFHDGIINSIARNTDGSELGDTKVTIAGSTLDILNTYDFGIYKGEAYQGTRILTLQELLEFSQGQSVNGVYVLIAIGTGDQIRKAVELSKQYNVKVSWICTSFQQAKAVLKEDSKARLALLTANIRKDLPNLLKLKRKAGEVFIFAPGNAILNDELVEELRNNDIAFEMGNIYSEEEIIRYWNGAYHYCSGIASDRVAASSIDVEAVVRRMKGIE